MQPRPSDSFQQNSSSLCLCSPTTATPRSVVAVRRRLFFFFTLHTTPRSRFLFNCALFFSSFVHCYHGFLSPRNFPFAQPGLILSPCQFSLFFRNARLPLPGIIVTASAGEVAREETKNMRCPPARFFFHLFFFFFSSEEEDHMLLCRISRTRRAIKRRPPLRRGTQTHTKESLPAFFRRVVAVFKSPFFHGSSFIFFISALPSCSLFLYLFFTFATSLGLLLFAHRKTSSGGVVWKK